MFKFRYLLILVILAALLAACGVPNLSEPTPTPAPPTPTPAPTNTPPPEPTDTPTPTPEITSEPTAEPEAESTNTPEQDAGIAIEKGEDGFVFQDLKYGYQVLLPGEDWRPFLPGKDDMNTFIDAAQTSMPEVDTGAIKQLMEMAGAQFRLYAFYTGKDGRSEDFVTNLNVITTPLGKGYDMTVVAKINKEQLLQTFPGSEVLSEAQITNSNGVRVGLVTIKNPVIAADGGEMPLAQTFIFSQTPENVLVSMTFSTPIAAQDAMKPLIEQIADSITFTQPE
jgi:hypothetical protein